jgi:hypothetical protein
MVPLPDEAMLSLPGFAFAPSTNSFSVLYGDDWDTTRMSGCEDTSAMGSKSFTGSNGSFP